MVDRRLDFNGDLGEGAGSDPDLLLVVTSANIACGGHAGDAAMMRSAVEAARRSGVAVGAHPGFEDAAGFGRRERRVSPAEAYDLVLGQVRRLQGVAGELGVRVTHVKPHGALYTMAARDGTLAGAVARAVREADARCWLVGLAGSALVEAGRAAGLRVAREGFADRVYEDDGSLTPRGRPDALVVDPSAAIAQVLSMVFEGRVEARGGRAVGLEVDTVCVHGDSPGAVMLARRVREALERAGVTLRPLGELDGGGG